MNNRCSFDSRRALLAGSVLLGLGTACSAAGVPTRPERAWRPANPMALPPLLDPPTVRGTRTFDLTARRGRHAYRAGQPTPTYGINGDVLEPTLRMRRGDRVTAHVHNTLPDTTTMHWHGTLDGRQHGLLPQRPHPRRRLHGALGRR